MVYFCLEVKMLVMMVFIAIQGILIGMLIGIGISNRGSVELTSWYDDYGWALPKHIQELAEKYGWKEVVDEYYKGNWG